MSSRSCGRWGRLGRYPGQSTLKAMHSLRPGLYWDGGGCFGLCLRRGRRRAALAPVCCGGKDGEASCASHPLAARWEVVVGAPVVLVPCPRTLVSARQGGGGGFLGPSCWGGALRPPGFGPPSCEAEVCRCEAEGIQGSAPGPRWLLLPDDLPNCCSGFLLSP